MALEDISEKQLEIINLLLEKPYNQKELQQKLSISSPGLLYHLDRLEDLKFITKKIKYQVGNARVNEIAIDPLQLQNIRKRLGIQIKNYTLITGFGELEIGYRIPDDSYQILQNHHYKIDNVVCITTKKGKSIRDLMASKEQLIQIRRFYADYNYNDFRDIKSKLFQDLDNILREELRESNLVIDITPLSKLYSFEMLKRANRYKLACFYIGKDEKENDSIIWMSDVQLSGEYQ